MICRVTGTLERVEGLAATVALSGGVAYEILLPAYLAQLLSDKVGSPVTLVTFHYLESEGQGSAYLPRLVGFMSRRELEFFELFTTVKGIGYRRALRALAAPPAFLARAIAAKDPRPLTEMPEIGKRLAETIIVELYGKVEGYLSEEELTGLDAAAAGVAMPRTSVTDQVIDALVALGETRAEAQRQVALVFDAARRSGTPPANAEALIELVYAARGR